MGKVGETYFVAAVNYCCIKVIRLFLALSLFPSKKKKTVILKLAANHDKVCLCISSTLSVVNFDPMSMKNPQQIKVQKVLCISDSLQYFSGQFCAA